MFIWEKRILYYWSKLYSNQLNKGENYIDLNKTICIILLDYELFNLKEIEKYHTTWKIIETEIASKVLIDDLEIHILEIPKFLNKTKNMENKLVQWLMFLENPEDEGVHFRIRKNKNNKKANSKKCVPKRNIRNYGNRYRKNKRNRVISII